MSTYVLVSFWLCAVGLAIRMISLCTDEPWPRVTTKNIGTQMLEILTGAGFVFWAGYLLWWGPR